MKPLLHSKKPLGFLNRFFTWLDGAPLWLAGFPLMAVLFAPYLILKQGSVFPVHDQLDETLLTYVLNARHLFDSGTVFPEILGGIGKSGMQPSAVLFIPLYCLFTPLTAFLIQYMIIDFYLFVNVYSCVANGTAKPLFLSSIFVYYYTLHFRLLSYIT